MEITVPTATHARTVAIVNVARTATPLKTSVGVVGLVGTKYAVDAEIVLRVSVARAVVCAGKPNTIARAVVCAGKPNTIARAVSTVCGSRIAAYATNKRLSQGGRKEPRCRYGDVALFVSPCC